MTWVGWPGVGFCDLWSFLCFFIGRSFGFVFTVFQVYVLVIIINIFINNYACE